MYTGFRVFWQNIKVSILPHYLCKAPFWLSANPPQPLLFSLYGHFTGAEQTLNDRASGPEGAGLSGDLVAEWIHFTLLGIILPTIKLKVYTFWGLWTQQLSIVHPYRDLSRNAHRIPCSKPLGALLETWVSFPIERPEPKGFCLEKAIPNPLHLVCYLRSRSTLNLDFWTGNPKS